MYFPRARGERWALGDAWGLGAKNGHHEIQVILADFA
jgi:hypothetical protein